MASFIGTQVVLQEHPQTALSYHLLNDFSGLSGLLADRLQQRDWLNAYLLAVGLGQIFEDYLHPDPLFLSKVPSRLAQIRKPAGPVLSGLSLGFQKIILGILLQKRAVPAWIHWHGDLTHFIDCLAEAVLRIQPIPAGETQALVAMGEHLLAAIEPFPPGLRRSVLHLPSCFRALDQQPADIEKMVAKFLQAYPQLDKPVLVVGIRTSGSYLAPLICASLISSGFSRVSWMTLRPKRRLLPSEISRLHEFSQQPGLLLLTDDPPVTGASIARAAAILEQNGIPAQRIVLFTQLLNGQDQLPSALQGYAAVTLPWQEWSIHDRLTAEAVRSSLQTLVSPTDEVISVKQMPLSYFQNARDHVHTLYQVVFRDKNSNQHREKTILVKGCGLGYFGQNSKVAIRELASFIPTVYGSRDGLMFREWRPEDERLSGLSVTNEAFVSEGIARYVAARSRVLEVPEDIGTRLVGDYPAWEVASNILSRSFGQNGWVLRLPVIDPLVLRLLQTNHPSVIDGSMALSRWFMREQDHQLYKADFDEGVSNDIELTCYDPVFDLASVVAILDEADGFTQAQVQQFAGRLRSAYEKYSSETVDEERWLLYQLVRIWELQRNRQHHSAGPRASARAIQRFYAEIFFKDLPLRTEGELCAFDLDGVLETDLLGFPALSKSSAAALRSLSRHRYRPVLATGRSLEEVQERCEAYRLAGGTAEYGAVIYNHLTHTSQSLTTPEEEAALDQIRAALQAQAEIYLDPRYTRSVRAYRLNSKGLPARLPEELTRVLLEPARGLIRAVTGSSQTDFVPARIHKGEGLRALIQDLGGGKRNSAFPISLAVGDTLSDLPMLQMAERSFAPAHAHALAQAQVHLTRQPYQRGAAEAVQTFLGHTPGGCAECALPTLPPQTNALLDILSAGEAGWRSMLLRLPTLALAGRQR